MDRLGNGKTIRILLATGDGRSLRARLGEEAGGGVAWTAVGRLEHAVELLRHERWDAVLLVPDLPDGEGPASVGRLRAAATDIAVLVVSAAADEGEALAYLEAGAQDYLDATELAKGTLLRAIRYALARIRAEQGAAGSPVPERSMGLAERAILGGRQPPARGTAAAGRQPSGEPSPPRVLARDERVLYYQPQLSPRDGTMVGVEALIRWRHAEPGMPASERFVPLAEERGLVQPAGEWALRTACTQLKRWRADGFTTGRITVTLSARDLLHRDPSDSLLQFLSASAQDPGAHETGDGAPGEGEPLDLVDLIVLGARVSIDDIGAGYASLGHLKRLPVEILKLDRSFAHHLEREPWDTAIVTSVIELGHKLGLKTVAEGVETGRQFAFLRRQGCDAVQGNLVCPPLPTEAFAAWLRGRKRGENLANAAGA